MKDELEDFVSQNREAFDDREPSANLWGKINNKLLRVEKKSWWDSVPMWRAAAIVFMALSCYLLIIGRPANPSIQNVAFKEFNDVEAFYVQQMSDKIDLINNFKTSDGLNGFTQNFKQLEAMYFVLKEEMKSHPTQKVKDALELNLLVRIDLLNQKLYLLEKSRKDDVNESKSGGMKKV